MPALHSASPLLRHGQTNQPNLDLLSFPPQQRHQIQEHRPQTDPEKMQDQESGHNSHPTNIHDLNPVR